MKFARWVFLISGIYGLIVVAPGYFMERQYGIDYPPAVTHPEHYYGFTGLCLVFQVLFLLISWDPVRYRPIMLVGVMEKLCFTIPCAILYSQGRIPTIVVGFSLLDLVLAGLFLASWFKTPPIKGV